MVVRQGALSTPIEPSPQALESERERRVTGTLSARFARLRISFCLEEKALYRDRQQEDLDAGLGHFKGGNRRYRDASPDYNAEHGGNSPQVEGVLLCRRSLSREEQSDAGENSSS